MDSCATAEATSSLASSFRNAYCDLLSHTLCQPATLIPHVTEQRGRLNLSDRKLSLQERPQTTASPCSSAGLSGRCIYPSLPYSPITSPHTSPRLPRRPTVESHSVSITDLQVESSKKAVCHSGPTSQGFFHLWVGFLILNAPLLFVLHLSYSSTNVEAVLTQVRSHLLVEHRTCSLLDVLHVEPSELQMMAVSVTVCFPLGSVVESCK